MAFWSKKEPEFDEVNKLIQQKPGIRPADLARETGTARSTISRRLASMEEAGYLYSEDEEGKLWPFNKGT
jgi:DNA-binding IclR family transcriptional regulator